MKSMMFSCNYDEARHILFCTRMQIQPAKSVACFDFYKSLYIIT